MFDVRLLCNRPKAKRVQTKFRTRTHREDVANDSAYTGGCSLKGFDRAWMIVAFNLESYRPAVADIDNTGVFFAGFHQNVRTDRWKFFQFFSRIFVGAVLTPHD